MEDKIISRLKDLIAKAEQEDEKDTTDRLVKYSKMCGLYEALNAVYDVFAEESK